LGLAAELMVLNRHALGKFKAGVRLEVGITGKHASKETRTHESELHKDDIYECGDDIVIVRVSKLNFRDITKHLSPDERFPDVMTALIGNSLTKAYFRGEPSFLEDRVAGMIEVSRCLEYGWSDHAVGMCGLPLFVQKDRGYCIAGVHMAGSGADDTCRAAILTRSMYTRAVAEFESRKKLLPMVSQSDWTHFQTEEPARTSIFRFHDLSALDYYGKVPGPILANSKSRFEKSYLNKDDFLWHLFDDVLQFNPSVRFTRPMMRDTRVGNKYISPTALGLLKISCQRPALNREVLCIVKDMLVDRFVQGLREQGVNELSPLTLDATINGAEDDVYIRRVDPSKAAGFGWPGSKERYLPIVRETPSRITREPTTDLRARLYDCMRNYEQDRTNDFVFKVQLKDEPRQVEKALAGKTRLFYSSSVDGLLMNRMYLCPFYSLMPEYQDLFCTAIGVDMHRDADDIYSSIIKFSRAEMTGDYGKYDQAMPFDVSWTACTVVYETLASLGYSKYALKQVQGLMTDSLFPFVELYGDIFCAPGLQPSGKYATAEDNSLKGLILLMYFWYSHPKLRNLNFFQFVRPVLYGDDVVASVKDLVKEWCNNLVYSKFVEEVYAMEYTSSVKGTVERPFETPEEMTFLKRDFRYNETLKRFVAPLDMNSIFKTLEWTSPPDGSCNPDSQALSVLQSSLPELFFHLGVASYETMREKLGLAYLNHFKIANTKDFWAKLPTYAELVKRFANREDLKTESDHRSPKSQKKSLDRKVLRDPANMLNAAIDSVEADLKEAYIILGKNPSPTDSMDVIDMQGSPQYFQYRSYREAVQRHQEALARVESLELTMKAHKRSLARHHAFRTESDHGEAKDGTADVIEKHENVGDISGEQPVEVQVRGRPQPSQLIQGTVLQISDFLRRPIQLFEFGIAADSDYDLALPIWQSYLSIPSIRAKLMTYSYLRAKLVVRITITGTPFHYGRVMVGYIPHAAQNEMFNQYNLNLSDLRINWLVYLSSTLGVKVINVCDNEPVEFEIPFIDYKEVLRLYNGSTSVLSASTNYQDAIWMGYFFVSTLNRIQAVSPSPSTVSCIITARMEDLELGPPTGYQQEIKTECNWQTESEWKTGPVEQTASGAARIFNALSKIPGFKYFTQPAEGVATGIASIAALFGWSYPALIDSPKIVRNEPYGNAAQTIGQYYGQRITYDPEQSLSADPGFVAVNKDELTFEYISSIWALLDQFEWSHTTAQFVPIWSCAVTPQAGIEIADVAGNEYFQPTPLAFCSLPFHYWRGKIHYRFEFVVSKFHRGKVGILFDPVIGQYVLTVSNIKINRQYLHLIDIQDTQIVDFCIDWASPRPWLRNLPLSAGPTITGTVTSPVTAQTYANGFITVFVYTRCQSPDDSNIPVNVYIRGESMEYAVADQSRLPMNRTFYTESDPHTVPVTCITLNPSSSGTFGLATNWFGERVVSFRSLLKRYVPGWNAPQGSDEATWGTVAEYVIPVIPPLIPSVTSAAGDPTYCTILSYLRYAFVAMRGSIRWRAGFNGLQSSGDTSRLMVTMNSPTTSDVSNASFYYHDDNFVRPLLTGSLYFVPSTNGGIDFEVPYYSNNLFYTAGSANPTMVLSPSFDPLAIKTVSVQLEARSGVGGCISWADYAAGEDFMLAGWIAAPMYTVPAP